MRAGGEEQVDVEEWHLGSHENEGEDDGGQTRPDAAEHEVNH